MSEEYDVIVIGARIAGSTFAALLGDAGYRVLLVDKANFPSPTVSTHFFRGQYMLAAMQRIGVLDDVLAIGSPKLVCQYVYRDGAEEPYPRPPQFPGDVGYSLSVRREPLDHLLVQRACQNDNVHLLEKTTLTDLL